MVNCKRCKKKNVGWKHMFSPIDCVTGNYRKDFDKLHHAVNVIVESELNSKTGQVAYLNQQLKLKEKELVELKRKVRCKKE